MANKTFGKVRTTVKGTSYENRQNKIWSIKCHPNGVKLKLRREPNNPHDPNAIQVIAYVPEINRHIHIGYVAKDIAFWLSKLMKAGKIVTATDMTLTGGGNYKYHGVAFQINYELPAPNKNSNTIN